MVKQHIGLVYSAALRQVRSPQLAEEIAQSVFTDLARSAARLKPDTILAAWLYQVARRSAIDTLRRESRRQARELIAPQIMNASPADWLPVEQLLDEAMESLDEKERAALLLRYFENKSMREVGEKLGSSEAAAQKRVGRALEHLRHFFANRGVAVGTGALAALVSANAVQAVPANLATAVASSAILSAAAGKTSLAVAAAKTITMTTLQKTVFSASMAALVAAGILQARRIGQLQNENEAARRQLDSIAERVQTLTEERNAATNALALLRNESDSLVAQRAEIPKLRAELARLRQDAKDSSGSKAASDTAVAEAVSWRERVNKLKERLEQTPSAKIPELQFLTDQDWLNAARGELNTDLDFRKAFSALRHSAENKFITQLQPALKRFMDANQGMFPSQVAQLNAYFETPVDESLFQRYQILRAYEMPSLGVGGESIITQTVIDEDYDAPWGIGPNGYGTTSPSHGKMDPAVAVVKTLEPVFDSFKAANGGKGPSDLSLLQPYATTPAQQEALQRLIKNSEAYQGGKN